MQNAQLSPETFGNTRVKHYKWKGTVVIGLTVIALVVTVIYTCFSPTGNRAEAAPTARTITMWSQALDSCRRAITGTTFNLTGPSTNVRQSDLQGKPVSVLIIPQGTGVCPVQQGNCVKFTNTCLQWHLSVPSSGTHTYTLKIITPANGHAGCVGGSVCASPDLKHFGTQLFEFATITVSSAGKCAAKVTNYNPNWTYNKNSIRTFPNTSTHASTYACTQADPVVFHESATHSDVSLAPNDCDGDHDADDHTTGAEGWSPTCDNDGDWNPNYRKGQHYTGGVSGAPK